MKKRRYVIIGASAAGISAANTIRRLDEQAIIICVSAESEFPYNKCFLADHLKGDKAYQELLLTSPEELQNKKIQLLRNVRVSSIEPARKQIITTQKSCIEYDSLMIATGSSPVWPKIKGMSDCANRLYSFHTAADSEKLLQAVRTGQIKRVIVVGGGLSGLECADSLSHYQISISVVEMKQQLLSRQVDQQGSELIVSAMHKRGIQLYLGERVDSIYSNKGLIEKVVLSSGRVCKADAVVFALGLRSNSQLATKCTGIQIEQGAVVTNDYMQTTVNDIYAAGDVALVSDALSGKSLVSCTWPDAMFQGLIAGHSMTGNARPYPGISLIISTSFFGVSLAISGPVLEVPLEYESKFQKDEICYKKLVLQGDRLRGFLTIGDKKQFSKLKHALLTGIPINFTELLNE